jgi:hypothetical protein
MSWTMSWTMSETMLNCDMPCSETQNASALARPGKALRMPGWPCFSHRISKLATCNSMGAPSWKRRERENQIPRHVWLRTRSIENPGLVKPLRRQADIKFENVTRSEKLGKGYSSWKILGIEIEPTTAETLNQKTVGRKFSFNPAIHPAKFKFKLHKYSA